MTRSSVKTGVTTAVVTFGVLLTLAGSVEARRPDPETRRKVVTLLSGYEYQPTLADWKRVGPDANHILTELVDDRELRPSIRLRALASLAWFPTKRSRAMLLQKLDGLRSTTVERRVAMRALALAWGAEVIPDIRHYLMSEELELREGAIRALGLIRGTRVQAVLGHHLGLEKDLQLRVLTDRVLERLRRPAPKTPPVVDDPTLDPRKLDRSAPKAR